MRLMKGPRLRVKDVDFDSGVLVVRQTKGDKDRVVMLPRILAAELLRQVRAARVVGARSAGAAVWTFHMHWRPNIRRGTTLGMVLGVLCFIPVGGAAHRYVATL